MYRFLLVSVLAASSVAAAFAEAPKLWKWTRRAKHLDAVVKIYADDGQATGVVVRPGRDAKLAADECFILTAFHVVEEVEKESSIRIEFGDGQATNKCQVVCFDAKHDLALLKSWAPKEIPAARTADRVINHKMFVEFAGLGGDEELKGMRHFSSRATPPTTPDFIYADETLLPGDSGGPVFNQKKQLVGIISGGWFWWDAGVKNTDGIPVLSTWPARASNLAAVKALLESFEKSPSESLADN